MRLPNARFPRRIIRATMTLRKTYYYFGWNCQTPSCDAEILCDYVGTKLRKQLEFNPPALFFGTCGKCGKTYEYSKDLPKLLSRSTFVQLRPKPN